MVSVGADRRAVQLEKLLAFPDSYSFRRYWAHVVHGPGCLCLVQLLLSSMYFFSSYLFQRIWILLVVIWKAQTNTHSFLWFFLFLNRYNLGFVLYSDVWLYWLIRRINWRLTIMLEIGFWKSKERIHFEHFQTLSYPIINQACII